MDFFQNYVNFLRGGNVNLELPHTVATNFFWEQTLYIALLMSVLAAGLFLWKGRKYIDGREEKTATKKDRRNATILPTSLHPIDRHWCRQNFERRSDRRAFR